MIVGGYSLDLYCDNVEAGRCVSKRSWQNEFYGQSLAETKRDAKAIGWSFKGQSCFCPSCTKARRR